jgi:cyclic pyranopterin phosphate synthase
MIDLLDIVLHYDCNLKCTYCTVTDEMRLRQGVLTKTVGIEIDRAAKTGCTALSITGGEPTTRPDLLRLLRFATTRGFRSLKVQTNGLVFANPGNLDRAIGAGLTTVGVSVHGFAPEGSRYERITQVEGSEGLMLAALDNLVAAPVELAVDLIMMTETQGSLLSAIRSLHKRGVERFNLWLVSLTDNNADNTESLPRIRDLIPEMIACFEYARESGCTVESLHVPKCALPGYEEHIRHPGEGRYVRVVTPESVFDLADSMLSGGVKPDSCSECRFESSCPGLRADYVDRFGVDELQPVA